jgi:hypothetical protein
VEIKNPAYIHSFIESDFIHLMPVVVSGCPMKGMAGYDHYEEIVFSLCPPVSCHCRTNMVEILSAAYSTKLSIFIVK